MLADDFVRQIALDALSTSVPVADNAVGVEHVKRIIRYAADQQAKVPLAVLQGLGGLASFGDVAGDLGKADQLSLFVNRVDHDGGEESRAVLANPPALGLESSVLARDGKGNRRHPCLAIFRGIEHSEILADDLGGFIALDAPGAGVPVGD